MIELTFLTGLLLGTLIGGAFCVRYLRREIAANVGPQLRQLNYKIEALESVLNLVLATRPAPPRGGARGWPPVAGPDGGRGPRPAIKFAGRGCLLRALGERMGQCWFPMSLRLPRWSWTPGVWRGTS